MRFTLTLTAIAAAASTAVAKNPSLLIFTKTAGFRHDSIPSGIELVTSVAERKNWSVTATEDSSIFTSSNLTSFTSLVFISTTGDFLTAKESDGLYKYLVNGGSWLGIHAAGDFGDAMPSWYNTLVGGQFASHPCGTDALCSNIQLANYPPFGNIRPDTINITNSEHPSTKGLPLSTIRADEWYSYKTNPSQSSNYSVLAVLNQDYIDVYTPESIRMAPDHPISWYSMFEGKARAFYTGMGHTNESYAEDYFIKHVTGGLEWVTGTTD
ncbi:ThuA-like domain-containing protein [Pseudomassariella vexata]|uniref:ThuA-like domain-containing protein n=1 Tax=Pseudomassariella vexata TaxID=1141098 RepID=A0A1Y2DYV7_9PEZI|nr:ThuA-like domain-containing protein [Pseudomassariella vexata]ORY64286.1 ThuA-like domain-containing protein [Pseudomassariella vexata]